MEWKYEETGKRMYEGPTRTDEMLLVNAHLRSLETQRV